MNATITLRDYLNKGKTFVIPSYQRGYVWGQKGACGKTDAVTQILTETLRPGFEQQKEIFLQGITVSESDKDIILIDGQQRTTFLFLLLKWLRYDGPFHIRYDVRSESDTFINAETIQIPIALDEHEQFQDIYFFKKTLMTINGVLAGVDKSAFLTYVLDNIKFLYIDIPNAQQATKVFSMMNGAKAVMHSEEIIKAEILHVASLGNPHAYTNKFEAFATEWDNNMLRSRYAREWDKWLQWWNREEVGKLFKCDNVMGLLISTYFYRKGEEKPLSYEAFKEKFIKKELPIEAKRTFDELRRLQKRFEDAFNDPISYNKTGAIIRLISKEGKKQFVDACFGEGYISQAGYLDDYYRKTFLGLTHKQIAENDNEVLKNKYEELYEVLSSDALYQENPEAAFRLLLRLNIDEDNLQEDGRGRKFDFSIWDRTDSRGRSLEHIYPKSRVWHTTDGRKYDGNDNPIDASIDVEHNSDYISRDSIHTTIKGKDFQASEHSIGNLVLLYKDDNATFSNSSFEDKKAMFFKMPGKNKGAYAIFKSRHLLNTIYQFASSEWKGKEIADNKYQILRKFSEYYGQQN